MSDDIREIGLAELDVNEFVSGDSSNVMFINETDVSSEDIRRAIEQENAQLSRVISDWAGAHAPATRPGGILSQNRYVAPDGIFDQFRMATTAVQNDDVISNAAETTEQLAFRRVEMHSENEQEANIWNQIKNDLKLERAMRQMWREIFTISQCYPAIVWTRKDYKVNGSIGGKKKSKKVYKNVAVPIGITLLDPCKVIPVGNMMFGQEKLIYIADPAEGADISNTLAAENTSDLIVDSMFVREYTPSMAEMQIINAAVGGFSSFAGSKRFFELNPDNVWRITSTRPDYQRFADVRLRSTFEILDLKHNLREMDRADILGNINSIILVRKGSDKMPANEREMAGVQGQMSTLARIPIIVSDHRLTLDIITRKTDNTLKAERYNSLDSRLSSRVYQTLATGSYNSGTGMDTSINLFKVISSTMEARRDLIRDSIKEHVFDKILEKNEKLFTEETEIRFYPGHVSLEFNQHLATYLYDLFTQGQLSHETILAEVDISLAEEAAKMRREQEMYGDVFREPGEPSATGNQKVDGRRMGGNNNGGGNNQDSYSESPRTGSPNENDK